MSHHMAWGAGCIWGGAVISRPATNYGGVHCYMLELYSVHVHAVVMHAQVENIPL